MPDISTVAVITAKPGAGDQVEQILRDLVEASHAESGCVSYTLHRGLQDRDVFVTVEKWDSPDSLDAHLASAHVGEAVAASSALLGAPLQIIPAAPLVVGDSSKGAF